MSCIAKCVAAANLCPMADEVNGHGERPNEFVPQKLTKIIRTDDVHYFGEYNN